MPASQGGEQVYLLTKTYLQIIVSYPRVQRAGVDRGLVLALDDGEAGDGEVGPAQRGQQLAVAAEVIHVAV